jgi:hypothetical protein
MATAGQDSRGGAHGQSIRFTVRGASDLPLKRG